MTVNVLIAFYSRGGVTEALAQAIAEGAKAEGAEVRLRRAREFVGEEVMKKAPGWLEGAKRMNALYQAPTEADAEWADALVFGTPTRFGSMTAELKAYIDGLGGLWFKGALVGKAGSAFALHFYPARRQRDDHYRAVCADGASRPDPGADWLCRPGAVQGGDTLWRVLGVWHQQRGAERG